MKCNDSINNSKFYLFAKGVFDFLISFLAIAILFPLLLFVFVIQIFVTKGHPIFCDVRVGKKEELLKF